MQFRTIVAVAATLFVAGSLALPVGAQVGAAPGGMSTPQGHHGNEVWDWYQGERGHWRQDKDEGKWRWFGENKEHRDNDEAAERGSNEPWEWYQGYRGHWKNERGGWHFHTPELICNNSGKKCHTGGEIPPNGEGMVSRRNPKFFWHCDSDGHHCNWAKRPGM